MIDLEAYLAAVDGFAAQMDRQHQGFELFVAGLKGTSALAEDCVTFRAGVMTSEDTAEAGPLLETGFFPDPDVGRRLAWWAFCFEIVRREENLALERVCQPYAPDQPLFVGAPALLARIRRRETTGAPDFELIDDAAVTCVSRSEVYVAGPCFTKLAPSLPARIPVWARETFPKAPRFLRLDPSQFHQTQPMMLLQEAAMVPANPNWMATLALFPETSTFAHYELLDAPFRENPTQFRDYHLRHIRRLEVRAQRREADYLSMLIEELPRADDKNGLMVGRCIHLDTRAVAGTPIAEVRLQHLDLAINVYTGADRARRLDNSLQHGKTQDATYRTHLYRIEDVPFPALFGFAELFLKSRSLLGEWLAGAMGLELGD
jgi:hypothetical protein